MNEKKGGVRKNGETAKKVRDSEKKKERKGEKRRESNRLREKPAKHLRAARTGREISIKRKTKGVLDL